MKVVLFCGGRGTRMLDVDSGRVFVPKRTTDVPKPMRPIGGRPLLWHLMTWYATHGHRDFILCVGFRADVLGAWVRGLGEHRMDEPIPGTATYHFLDGEAAGWKITVLDGGLDTPVGQRLRAARPLVAGEDLFLANYADGLSDVPLPSMIEQARRTRATTTMLVVPPPASMHSVRFRPGTREVDRIGPLAEEEVWVNAGFFVMRPEVFGVLHDGEDLVDAPFARLARAGSLAAYPYTGFWRCMDTAKDRHLLDQLWLSGKRPWAIWEKKPGGVPSAAGLLDPTAPHPVERPAVPASRGDAFAASSSHAEA